MQIFLTLLTLIVSAFAQRPQDPVQDFCRIYGHQTAVIDRKLYIDGGWVYANPIAANPVPTINQGLLYGALDKPNDGNFPTVYTNASKNNSIPDVSGGILWADRTNKIFWLYGGQYQNAPSNFQLWGYDVILNQWNLSTAPADASSTIERVANGAGTTLHESGKGYYYGGYISNLTSPRWSGSPFATNGLIVYDMDHNTLTNKTGPLDGVGRAEGVMVSIPASDAGMLVHFGGVRFPYHNTTEEAESMEYIRLYDIGDEKWYVQRTTGQIPPNRRKFCGGVASAGDKSSYNIYIYGGFGFGENSTGFDDLYILTLPTFQWIKWYPEPGAATNPHGYSSCDVIDNSQMIIMGGDFLQHKDCDAPDVFGMHNLFLGENSPSGNKWFKYSPNISNYVVPATVLSAIGGSPTGGATQVSPINGWSDPALKVYFNGQAQYRTRTPTRSLPNATGAPGSGQDRPANLGPIIGGAVGGTLVILAAILTFCWYRRRGKNKNKTGDALTHAPPHSGPSELHGTPLPGEKTPSVAHVIGSPATSGPYSPGHSPYSTTPLVPPMHVPYYTYPPGYHHPPSGSPDHVQDYYARLSPSQQYPPHLVYGYGQYPPGTYSPPEGWMPHHAQQYFPAPDPSQRSLSVSELPPAESPTTQRNQLMRSSGDGQQAQQSSFASRSSIRVRRKEVGGANSPSETTVTQSDATNYSRRECDLSATR